MGKIILDLCGGTGSWSKPYKDAGYDVRVVTLPENDVITYSPPKNVYGVLAAPPCTEFSIVRNKNITNDFDGAMKIVNACLDIVKQCKPKFWGLENPAGHLKKFIGKAKYSFQPWYFGDPWTKHTMIWGEFNEPLRQWFNWESVPKIDKLYIRPERFKPSMACQHLSHKQHIPQLNCFHAENDAAFRAITPPGFARYFFEANK